MDESNLDKWCVVYKNWNDVCKEYLEVQRMKNKMYSKIAENLKLPPEVNNHNALNDSILKRIGQIKVEEYLHALNLKDGENY